MNTSILRFMIPKSLVEFIDSESTVRQAFEKMTFHKYTAIPVIDSDGKYIGTLRNDDVFQYFLKMGNFDITIAEDTKVCEIFSPTYSKPLRHDATVEELIDEVKEHNFVPIVDDRGCFIGLILRREILNYLLTHFKDFN